jgi:hypothetical protein
MVPPEIAKKSQDAYAADTEMQRSLSARLGPLTGALATLRAHPDMQTVGQDELNQLVQVAHAFNFPVGDLNQANAYQELSKNLEQYLRSMPGANRSDLAQSQAGAASPHIGQGRGAMVNLLAKAVGYERLRASAIDNFNAQYPDAATAQKNASQYNAQTIKYLESQDPVAYAVDELPFEDYKKYIDGLTPAGKAKLKKSREDATRLYPDLHPTIPAAAPAAPPPAEPPTP